MRVLVTGAAGFIGSHVTKCLLAAGHQVVAVDDLSSGHRRNLPDEVELIELDLGRRRSLDRLRSHSLDAICHLAGQSSGEKSFDDPAHDFDANARSTAMLAAWARDAGVPRLVHASSMSVYGEPSRLPVDEDAPTAPLSFYGASKLAAEELLAVAGAYGVRTVSLRMFSVYGPGQDLAELRQGIVSIYLAYLLRGATVPVTGSLDRIRDLVHVDDVAAAWRLAVESPVSGAINIGTGVGTTVRQLIGYLAALLGLPADHPVREVAPSPGDQQRIYADITRAREQLGWSPTVALEDGLRRMVEWAACVTSR